MRFALLLAPAIVLTTALPSVRQSDVYKQFGTNPSEAHDSFISSFTTGNVFLIGERSVFKAASPEVRATLVRGIIAAARAYTGTADFTTRYAQFREEQKPRKEHVAESGDQAMAEVQKQLDDSIKEMQKAAAGLPPEMKKQMEESIADLRKQMKEAAEDPIQKAERDKAFPEMAKAAEAEYRGKLGEWDERYPADLKLLITKRLRAFLDLSSTVDFNAKLEPRPDKKLHFVDPALEGKPSEWKLLFRAGKPAVDAAREAAREWLKAIGG
jgi:hypothetical protein